MKRTPGLHVCIQRNIHTVNHSLPQTFIEYLSIILVCEILTIGCESVRGFYRLVMFCYGVLFQAFNGFAIDIKGSALYCSCLFGSLLFIYFLSI
jgi:hypothetical protein